MYKFKQLYDVRMWNKTKIKKVIHTVVDASSYTSYVAHHRAQALSILTAYNITKYLHMGPRFNISTAKCK